MAYKLLNDRNFDITYWRTKTGIEVDFILGEGEVAIKVKIMDKIQKADIKPLEIFMEEHQPRQGIIVSLIPKPRKIQGPHGDIDLLPLRTFLDRLWCNEIL